MLLLVAGLIWTFAVGVWLLAFGDFADPNVVNLAFGSYLTTLAVLVGYLYHLGGKSFYRVGFPRFDSREERRST